MVVLLFSRLLGLLGLKTRARESAYIDRYEDTYLERPSTKPQGIAHVISSATSFTKKGETIY